VTDLSDDTKIHFAGETKHRSSVTVLRFIVHAGQATADTVAAKSRELHEMYSDDSDDSDNYPNFSAYPSISSMQFDGHEALMTVFCGHAACHWTIEVLQPRECSILSTAYEQSAPPPRDELFPILSILHTVHLELPKK
jgi:hypothetical protein